MGRHRWTVLAVIAFALVAQSAVATPAKVFTIKTAHAADIVSDADHYNVVFVTGWVSSKDSFFRALLSSTSKTAAIITATGTYFDGEQLKNAWVVENSDVGRHLDRPWGIENKPLLANIPADTDITDISVRFEIHKDDRIKQLLGIVQGAEPVAGISVEPYLTYAKVVDGIFNRAFGTDKTKYPFTVDTGLADPNIQSADGMYEHYLIAISPNKDGDQWLENLNGTKLSFNPATKQLTYNGQIVTDHTYAIFLVQKADGYNIARLTLNSNAPWAALALGSFYEGVLPSITKAAEIPNAETQYVKTLGNCTGLLKRELRFSSFDRAKALDAFALRARTMIRAACQTENIGMPACKTPLLDSFISGLATLFPLKNTSTILSFSGFKATALNSSIKEAVQIH